MESQTCDLPENFSGPLTQKEWMRIIHRCLLYLSENNPPSSLNLYKEERQLLPSAFLNSKSPAQFCYPFKGIFLPSGNMDGKVWKPSQGARPTGDGLMKRYFYFKEGGTKIKRQVIWLTSNENWCFLDYRFNFKGKINVQQMQIPAGFDFFRLLSLAENVSIIGTDVNESPEGERKRTLEVCYKNECKVDNEVPVEDQQEHKSIAAIIPSQEEVDILRNEGVNFNDPDFLDMTTMFDGDPDSEPLGLEEFMRSFEEDTCTLPQIQQPLIPYIKEESEPEELVLVPKKRKLEVEMIPVPIPVPVHIPVASSYYSFSFSPFDYLLNHLLSYDQILDTVCQSICTQLIFNRSYFYKSGLDPNTILQSLMQRCTVMTVDYREFPSSLMSTFFRWLYECVYGGTPAKIPTVYCLICGCPDHAQHDVKAHTEFYSALDQPLLEGWKNKAANFYDVLKELIGFLLRYPNSRQSFRSCIETYLHCPYCSRKNGTHCHEKHEEWRIFYHFEAPPSIPQEPEKTDNVANYTKSSFEYLMEHMPFQIPSFLLSLNNVQSFLDCLISIWRSLRLFSN